MKNSHNIAFKLREYTDNLQFDEASELYSKNFNEVSLMIERGVGLGAIVDAMMALKRFTKACQLWRFIFKASKSSMRLPRFIKLVRCFYYAGYPEEAREYIFEWLRFSESWEKDQLILLSIMAECGDDRYVDLLSDSSPSNIDDKFFIDRAALFSHDRDADYVNKKKYLFVSGTPRAGTTIFGEFLSAHSKICMTTERYGPGNGYNKKMFLKENVFADGRNGRYSHLYDKYDECLYVGDKRPNFLMSWDITKRNFLPEEMMIFHLLRDPYLVAESYFKRTLRQVNGKDSWSERNIFPRDQFVACWDYNINNKVLLNALHDSRYSSSLIVLNSDDVYRSKEGLLEVFDHLGVTIDKEIINKSEDIVKKSSMIRKERHVTNETIDIVEKHFDFSLYKEVTLKSQH